MIVEYLERFFQICCLLSIYAAGYCFGCSRTNRKLKELIVTYRGLIKEVADQNSISLGNG